MNYFLKEFPSTEWSGPAWYKPHYKKDEKYPKGFTLIHFHPVDLGHGTATVIDAGDTAKILQKTWKEYPETEKCMMGIIHSHHTMGAFFSGTDNTCLEDNAPIENFYCSTVVASKKEKFAFAVAYADQYGKVHLHEADDSDIGLIMPPDTEEPKWKYIVKKLEKKKKAEVATTTMGYYGTGGRYNQGNLWGGHNRRPYNGYGYPIGYDDENPDVQTLDALKARANVMEDPEGGYITLLAEAYKDNKILFESFKDELQDMGIDAVSFINAWNDSSRANNSSKVKEVKDVLALPEASEKSGPDTADPVG